MAVAEDKGFVAFLKHLLHAIGWGCFGIGAAGFEIRFTVNAMIVRTGKYEVIRQ
jgi:hypothetical protein